MASKWEVASTTKKNVTTSTATYTVDGKVAAVISGLAAGVKAESDGSAVPGISIAETASGNVFRLSKSVLGTTGVTLSLKNGYKYTLGLSADVDTVTAPNATMTYTEKSGTGTITVKGDLTAGYTLAAKGNSISYSAAKTGQTLATISGLAGGLTVASDGKSVGLPADVGGDGEGDNDGEDTTTVTPLIELGSSKITLRAGAFNEKNVALKLSNGATYTLALYKNSEDDTDTDNVPAPTFDDSTDFVYKNGNATYNGSVGAGYTLSKDGKTVTYTAENANSEEKALITVKGVSEFSETDNVEDYIVLGEETDANNFVTVTLKPGALNKKNVTISGTGVNLALGEGVTDSDVQETNLWSVSGTTATYKTAKPEYYTYDAAKNQVVYTKQADVATLATVSNLKSGLKTAVTYDKNTHEISGGDVLNGVDEDGTLVESVVSVNSSGVITLKSDALNSKNVTLKNGTDATYSLKLDSGVQKPTTSGEVWSVSGTTATLKGTTTGGYFETDANTITFAKKSDTTPIVLVTVKGLKKGVSLDTEDNTIGWGADTDYVAGLRLGEISDATPVANSRTITLSKNVLGANNVSISPAAGYGDYKFALYDSETGTYEDQEKEDAAVAEKGGLVPTEGIETKLFAPKGAKVSINQATSAYYTLSEDGKTLAYTGEEMKAEIASIKGLKSTITATNGEIKGLTFDGNDVIINDEDGKLLNNATVTITTNTGFKTHGIRIDDSFKPHNTKVWSVSGTTALLIDATSAGYTPNAAGTELTYSKQVNGATLATVKGLRTGLTVKDGAIDGIQIGTVDEDGNITDSNIITLSAKALGTTDVELNAATITAGYRITVDKDSVAQTNENAETDPATWTVTKKTVKGVDIGTATYTVKTTKAGFVVVQDPESGDNVSGDSGDDENPAAGIKLLYKKKATVTSTITGVNPGLDNDEIATPDENGVITLKQDQLMEGNATLKTSSGYKLALAREVEAPNIKVGSWTLKKATATLSGTVAKDDTATNEGAGWLASADGLTISYMPVTEENKTETLATITGIQSGISNDVLNDGIGIDGNILTLSKEVLGASKIAVSGGNYIIKLADGVPTETKDETGWVTNGTTATYKSYKIGYYTPASDTLINFTKPTAGTTYATIKGVKSGADLTSIGANKTVALTSDMLGTSKVTITGTGYSLKLASTVPQTGENAIEWVTSGTTATKKNYTKAYYTMSGGAVIYHAPTKGTTYATVSGIASDAKITDSDGVVTLNDDQLAEKKVTIKGDGYSLKLADSVESKATAETNPDNYVWSQAKNKDVATYEQPVSAGYALSTDAKTITYSAVPTYNILAKLSGVTKNTGDAIEHSETGITGIEIDNENNKLIKLSESVVPEKKKVTITSDYDYKLGSDAAAIPGDWKWGINASKGTASYQQTTPEGLIVSSDGKTVTNSDKEATEIAATVSGLDKTALKALLSDGENTGEVELATLEAQGIAVTTGNTNVITLSKIDAAEGEDDTPLLGTSKITLGKKDTFEFKLVDALLPAAGANKWTVSGTTATYSSSTTEGYRTTDSKTVAYVKAAAGDALISISGLKKGLKVSEDGKKVGVQDKTTKVVSDGIILRDYENGNYDIELGRDALGTTDIKLTNNTKDNYQFTEVEGNTNPQSSKAWSYSNGTATYKDTQTGGYTISTSKDTVKYTAAATTTLATVSGLVKGFTGELTESISESGGIITIKSALLGTSKVSLKVPKGSTYSLDLDGNVAQFAQTKNAQWVTNGTTATYKDYQDAYYTIASDGKSISYVKPKDITVYATVKGIKSGVDITDSFDGDKNNGGTITLNAKQLTTTNVTVSKPKTSAGTYTLALQKTGNNAPLQEEQTEAVTEWVTNKTTATYQKYWKGHYTYDSAKNAVTYTKPAKTTIDGELVDRTKATVYASITGANGDLTVKERSGYKFEVSGNGLSNKITVSGYKPEDTENDHYSFNFLSDYNNAAITGTSDADTIAAQGDRLTITGGKGNDEITFSNKTNRTGNVFVYAKGDGKDVIANFTPNDSITTKSVTPVVSTSGDDEINITFGSVDGSITLQLAEGVTTMPASITINGKSYATSSSESENVLLADDNYRMDAAQLSDIVQPAVTQYTPYDFDSGLGLTKEEKFTPEITFAKDDK